MVSPPVVVAEVVVGPLLSLPPVFEAPPIVPLWLPPSVVEPVSEALAVGSVSLDPESVGPADTDALSLAPPVLSPLQATQRTPHTGTIRSSRINIRGPPLHRPGK